MLSLVRAFPKVRELPLLRVEERYPWVPIATAGSDNEGVVSPQIVALSQAVVARAADAGTEIAFMGAHQLFSGHRVFPADGRDWVVVELGNDPLLQHESGFPIPSEQIRALRKVQAAGIEFTAIYIAHEVRTGSVREGAPLEIRHLEPPPPRALQKLSHRLGTSARSLWNVGTVPIRLARVVTVASVTVASALPHAILIDPVVMGAIVPQGNSRDPGSVAAWFYLTHWNYGSQS